MAELGLHATWQGLRLLAVDGSSMHLPLEDALARHFGTHNGLPVARVSVLQDLLADHALHTLLITPDVDERSCAGMHLEHAPDNSLMLFDPGYPAHWLFVELQRCQQQFLMRLTLIHSREVRAFVASGKRRRHGLNDVPSFVLPTGLSAVRCGPRHAPSVSG